MPYLQSPAPSRIEVGRRGRRVVVRLHGPLDDGAYRQMQRFVTDLVEGQGNLFVSVEHCDGEWAHALLKASFGGHCAVIDRGARHSARAAAEARDSQ